MTSSHDNSARSSFDHLARGARRQCPLCGDELAQRHHGRADHDRLVEVPCHVRAFQHQRFHLWRCACGTIHCLEKVDLATYYAQYPFAKARLTRPFRIFYRHLLRRLTRVGFSRHTTLLDYGCGRGLFLRYLKRQGFAGAVGYDPYGDAREHGNPAALDRAPFDFILLQDVLEHVEDPFALLAELDGYLKPCGRIVVGTPNAARLDLANPHMFLNELHAPYHLHIYNRAAVEGIAARLGWMCVAYHDRAYHDTPWPCLNTRAAKVYQTLIDGTLDAALEPVRARAALASPLFWAAAVSGYWFSQRADMTLVFEKPAGARARRAAA